MYNRLLYIAGKGSNSEDIRYNVFDGKNWLALELTVLVATVAAMGAAVVKIYAWRQTDIPAKPRVDPPPGRAGPGRGNSSDRDQRSSRLTACGS